MAYDLYLYFREKPEGLPKFLKDLGFPKRSSNKNGTEELFQHDPKKVKTYTMKGKPPIFPLLSAGASYTELRFTNAIDIRFYNEPPDFTPDCLEHETFVAWADIEVYGIWDMLKDEQEKIAEIICEKYGAIAYDPQIDEKVKQI